MKRLLYFFSISIAFAGCDSSVSIEDPEKSAFIKYYGLDGDQTGKDLVVLPDGNMILFGTTRPTVPTKGVQWYVVKVDPKGKVLWEKEFGGLNDEEARDIEFTSSNEIVLVGNSYKTSTDRDVMIMKLDLDGLKLDSALIAVRDSVGVVTSGDEDVTTVTETSDGFLISGSSTYVWQKAPVIGLTDSHDALKIRVFTDLTEYPNTWIQTYGYYSDDVAQKIIQLSPSSYYVFGFTNSLPVGQTTPNYNFWAYEMGANGDVVSQPLFVGLPSGNERLSSVAIVPTQSVPGYLLGGLSQSGTTPTDFYVAKITTPLAFSTSDILFEKPLSINLGSNLQGRTALAASLGIGFFVLGEENGFDNNQNWVLTKINTDGSLAWNLPIVYGGEGLDECGAVQELPDRRLVIIGTMRTGRPDAGEFKLTLIKVSAEGKFE